MCRNAPQWRLTTFIAGAVMLFATTASVAQQQPIFVDQGPEWNAALRADFYTRDQGSRMIPLAWLKALKQPNGQPFLADSLSRYGYLPNPDPLNRDKLPIGFSASGPRGLEVVGMTCSACHTRQIMVDGRAYRIDGGPGIVDFQTLLTDLETAVDGVLKVPGAFQTFAAEVLKATNPSPEDVAELRKDVDAWYLRYHTLMSRALPKDNPWGPARLDAVGMIFNRLTGLDLGPAPSFLIPENIKVADAPVRYPFLWNAPIQDQTQWPGFADNGSDILALARNLGEVFGVFGQFEPKKDFLLVDFLNNNSANFDGLSRLEDLIKALRPPKWPWAVDIALAAQGKAIFERPTAQGGCAACHGIRPGKVRFPGQETWDTPVQNVGTDTREYNIIAWTAKTGVLEGAFIPVLTDPLEETDLAINVLRLSVLGSIIEHFATGGGIPAAAARIAESPEDKRQAIRDKIAAARGELGAVRQRIDAVRDRLEARLRERGARRAPPQALPPQLRDLEGAFRIPQNIPSPSPTAGARTAAEQGPPAGAYESRVLQGIWATAPYLHNGSVPTLADLLKPAAQRAKAFKIGNNYDIANVGLAADQTQFNFTLTTTGCATPQELNSGRSNCGHEFGTTTLNDAEKKALLEYLKTL
jgi:mono/diheme cytochrome c family protein